MGFWDGRGCGGCGLGGFGCGVFRWLQFRPGPQQEAFILELNFDFFYGLHQVVVGIRHLGNGGGHGLPGGLHPDDQLMAFVGEQEEAFSLVVFVLSAPDQLFFFELFE